jgi:hypothetical protein
MTPRLARVSVILAVGALALAVLATAQPKDPFVGTWKLNLAKSKYSPGPPPKSSTVTYEAAGTGYKVSVRTEPASGATQEWSYSTMLDGKDSPITGNNPSADTIAAKRTDAHTIESVSKKGGKVTITARIVASADGRTRTNTQTGTNAQGQQVNNVLVFERQ